MINSLKDMIKFAKLKPKKVISVAVAQDKEVLQAIKIGVNEGIIIPILVGDKDKIIQICNEINFNVENYEIIDEKDKIEACNIAVNKVTMGQAHIIMKGIVDTSIILKAILKKEANLRTGRVLSHVGIMDVPTLDRLLLISDPAINISPDIMAKKQIIENAVIVAKNIGIDKPKVAIICANEKVNSKMPATVHAKELEEMNKRGEITDCIVAGPLALDNAVIEEAAIHKGIDNPVAGKADILIVPFIEVGNVLYKSLVFLGNTDAAGVIVGAKVPVVVTSRADSEDVKINSIALAMLMASN